MSSFTIDVDGGKSVKLLTKGKFCDRDIVVNAIGGGGGQIDTGVLPIGYTLVPKIRFDGSQAIDTGIIGNQDLNIIIVFTVEDDSAYYIYGCGSDNNIASVTAYRSGSGGRWRFGNQNAALMTDVEDKIVWCAQVNKKYIMRGNVKTILNSVKDFETPGTIVLGGGRLADGTIEEGTRLKGTITKFTLFNDNEVLCNYIPCKNEDDVCGFWDTVTEQFITSVDGTPLTWDYL